jgi:hypothetical protein
VEYILHRVGIVKVEKLFPTDVMTKRQRVEAALNLQPIDRAPLLEQLSYNPRVIADWTGKNIEGYTYTADDIGLVVRKTMDLVMPPVSPRGTDRYTTPDGFVYQNDNWTRWHVSRPFTDEKGACEWLRKRMKQYDEAPFDPIAARKDYRRQMLEWQGKVGETVILNYSKTGFCGVFDPMGLEIFTFFQMEYPEVLENYQKASTDQEVRRVHAVADRELSPVILIPEDFATKQGPIFPPEFLRRFHYPYVKKLTEVWHEHDVKVLYHTDGNYRKAIPDLLACGVDGFYCLEPNCSMDIVELKNTWPQMVWAAGVDGVDLMERGTPQQVRDEVRRHIVQTNVLETGGMFVASSSEINPTIPPENFRAMVEVVGEIRNPRFIE